MLGPSLAYEKRRRYPNPEIGNFPGAQAYFPTDLVSNRTRFIVNKAFGAHGCCGSLLLRHRNGREHANLCPMAKAAKEKLTAPPACGNPGVRAKRPTVKRTALGPIGGLEVVDRTRMDKARVSRAQMMRSQEA